MDPSRRVDLVARYRQGPAVLRAAVSSLRAEDLDRRPGGDEWSARQVVHHVADSEMTSAIRLRKLLAEDVPIIEGYDEMAFSRVLHYDTRPIEPSLVAIEGARATSADLLDRLTEAEWARTGTHSESGAYGVERWLEIYAAHCHEHADQIREAVAS